MGPLCGGAYSSLPASYWSMEPQVSLAFSPGRFMFYLPVEYSYDLLRGGNFYSVDL